MHYTARVLVVDDEQPVRVTLKEVLSREDYEVLTASSGQEALQVMGDMAVDLVMVDLKMEGMDGLTLMREIKQRWPTTVLIILTGYATLESALKALRHGAHDYLLKPSGPEDIKRSVREGLEKRRREARKKDLLAQIEAGVRELTAEGVSTGTAKGPGAPRDAAPGQPESPPLLEVGPLVIDLQMHMATLNGRPLKLTPFEFGTLTYLAQEAGRVVTCSALVKEVQGYDCYEQEARTIIKTHIRHLRQKLESDPSNPEYILNVRGVGYMLVAPSSEAD
ncbi:MAG: response regulator transcription factor [Anaerolineae bacterium]|nr:response regulator transcription factor [Anaerolineae bacterium]